ncbi:beta-ketoacyl-ACP synthase II [Lacrimispora saccharolytica]|uniref:beta-ketoacyl-ACP synthase II n=1 Tax=Lacrimispora saccharolytica TaxID=84030 RepID=UPI00265CD0AC|nr:beta-ketoacyl-ACP synthase II [Lacrimispora saccharolytica]MCF2655957.1 beta-ketoacyl-ACP synthase II [Lacrimispora saccharolytica]
MSRRVVITGLGAITPIGNSVDDFYAGIKEGRIGLDNISKFDTSDFRVKIAAEVKDFAPENYMDKKAARRMEPFCQYAVAAAGEAIKDSGLDIEKEDPFMVGCAIASGVGSLQLFEKEHTRQLEKGGDKVAPLFIPMFISNMAAGNVSITYGLKGKNINVVTACASGTNSVGEAFRTIQYGDADVMLAGGSEASITPMGIAGFSSLNALSVSEDKSRCSIPFDKDRNGFVMGEGAAILVLEELEHARKRGAKIYAEVVGYGCSADAYHITSPDETGEGAARAMLNACNDAGVSTDDIDYINAHGTSTHHNDLFETKAIKLTFGEHAYDIMINSTKSMIGHLLGAAGAIELVTCAKELEDGFVHATVGLKETEEEMDLDYCKESRNADIQYALSNSFGFGGHNACVLLKKWS